ncbi:hypothetical protein WCLP8_2120008 [uncultured Gammaproteobacteria bacterium]
MWPEAWCRVGPILAQVGVVAMKWLGLMDDQSDRPGSDPAVPDQALYQEFLKFLDAREVSDEWGWETDADGRVTWVSGRYGELAEGLAENIVGRHLVEMLDESAGGDGPVRVAVEALAAGRTFTNITCGLAVGEKRSILVSLNGKARWGKTHRDREASFLGFRGIGRNVTRAFQRERAWRDLCQQNQLLAATIEACPVSISIADATRPDCPLIYVNPSFTHITGYAFHEVIDTNCRFLCGPETDPVAVARIREGLRSAQPVSVEVLNYRKDGSTFWNEVMISPLVKDGVVVAFIGIQNDVTEKKLRQSQNQQNQKLEALGHLAGGVAHELNNLLQPIMTYGELIRDRLPVGDEATIRQIGRILASAEKARDIVRNVLSFARNDAPVPAPVVLAEALREALDFIGGLLPATVAVKVSGIEDNLGIGRINAVELTQVLTNLINNAVQAMVGRGAISIAAVGGRLNASAAVVAGVLPGNYCMIQVKDNGPGMDHTTLARLFEPFFTTKPVGQGTGLGLSVVYGILRSWGGAISVRSVLGKGAEFTLYIPQQDDVGSDGNGQDSGD